MSLTKADIIDSIYNRLDHSRSRTISLLETTLEIIKATLESGENIFIKPIEQKRSKRGKWQTGISHQLSTFKHRF